MFWCVEDVAYFDFWIILVNKVKCVPSWREPFKQPFVVAWLSGTIPHDDEHQRALCGLIAGKVLTIRQTARR